MARFRKLRDRPSIPEAPVTPRVEWALAPLVDRVQDAASVLEAKALVAPLVHARLADQYREIGLEPPRAEELSRQIGELEVESLRRLAVAVAMLDDAGVREALLALAPRVPVAVQVEMGFLGLARDVAPLTIGLVRQSAVRAEEFARHFTARLGVGFVGETDEQSRSRLHALDYKRLLAEVDQAKAAAQANLERLRKKQVEADQVRRRGKW